MGENQKRSTNILRTIILTILAILFLAPIILILINSFKGKLYISNELFSLPNATTFVGFENYIRGIETVNFWSAFGYSLFISVFSVATIVIFTSMTAWYIIRVNSKFTNFLYYLFIFSMIVPFQMVMYTTTWTANQLRSEERRVGKWNEYR